MTTVYTYRPTKKQGEAHEAVERYVLYGGAYRGGKTAWLVNEGIQLSLDYPGNVGYLCRYEMTRFKAKGGTLDQLLKFLPPELILNHHQSPPSYIQLKNGSVIAYGGLSGDEETKSRISGMELGWFGIDQAEEISEMQFLLLAGRLALVLPNIRHRGLLTANPAPGWLRDRFIENCLPDHRYIPALPKDNIEHLPSNYEDELRLLYPPEMAKRLLEGNWDIDLGVNYMFPYAKIREAVQRNLLADGDKVAGLDISREGNDETVFILRQGDKVLHIEAWSHELTNYTAGRTARLIREHKPTVVNLDSISIGVGVLDPLKKEGFPVVAVNVGEKALDHELYFNKRVEYYHLLAKKFQEGTIDIPDHPKLTAQLAGIKYDYRETRMFLESKKHMKKHMGQSPDYADALMLAFIPQPQFGGTGTVHVQYI